MISKLKTYSLGMVLCVLSPAMAATGLMLGEPATPPHLTPSVIARKNAQALVPEILNALRYWVKVRGGHTFSFKFESYALQDPYAPSASQRSDWSLYIQDEILDGQGAYVGVSYDRVSLACLFDALIGPHADFEAQVWMSESYPQIVAKMEKARIGLPACAQTFQPAPDNIQLATNIPKPLSIAEELLDYYDQATQPTTDDLVGNFESRCYTMKSFSRFVSVGSENKPSVVEFSGEKVRFDGGNRFSAPSSARLTFPKLRPYDVVTFDLGALDQDASLSAGALRIKKYDRYLILKFVRSANRPVGAYHPQADLDASAVESVCYAWKKEVQQ